MEEYKRALCWHFGKSTSEEEIYAKIKNDPSYTCNLNENGLLHSTYNGTHYEPAIIQKYNKHLIYYWMFDGKIKDCLHPFMIHTFCDKIIDIHYYSSDRIQANQYVRYNCEYASFKEYNTYYNWSIGGHCTIIDDDSYKYDDDDDDDDEQFNKDMFTPEWYPLCNEIDYKFKFAD